jgi:tRNA(Arg) A34 adenosine deaminase TadA
MIQPRPIRTEKAKDLADEKFMRLAIATAREGIANGQEPFGACIIKGEEVISVAHNTTIEDMDVTAHAEMNAIREACRKLKTTNLSECVIYATFKPCPMCHAACERANISRIYYGAGPEDSGASPREFRTLITAGFLKNECSELVQSR